MPADRVFREMRSLGLPATEAGPDGFLPRTPDRARSFLRGYDLGLVGGFVPVVLHRDPASALAVVDDTAARFARAGGSVVVLAAASGERGYDNRPQLSEAEWQVLYATLAEAARVAQGHDVQVVLHPHVGTVVETGDDVQRVLDHVATPLCLDTGHLLIGGVDPLQLVRAAADRVAHVHLKDVDARRAQDVRQGLESYADAVARGLYRPLGGGDIDVAGIVETLEASGYQGWYVLEQDVALQAEPGSDDGPAGQVQESRNYLLKTARAVASKHGLER
jgi:inosose dehydratase